MNMQNMSDTLGKNLCVTSQLLPVKVVHVNAQTTSANNWRVLDGLLLFLVTSTPKISADMYGHTCAPLLRFAIACNVGTVVPKS